MTRAQWIGTLLISTVFAWAIGFIVYTFLIIFVPGWSKPVPAHDLANWILKGQKKNAAGEWCCGEGDCFAIPKEQVTYGLAPVASADEQRAIWGYTLYGIEFVPEIEAQPSQDGQFWRCKRPDGSRRCFFAPPPSI